MKSGNYPNTKPGGQLFLAVLTSQSHTNPGMPINHTASVLVVSDHKRGWSNAQEKSLTLQLFCY